MLSKVDYTTVTSTVLGFDTATGTLHVRFDNPYDDQADHVRQIVPVIGVDGSGNPTFDQAATNLRIADHRRSANEKMYGAYKAKVEEESGVGDALTSLFGSIGASE